MTQMTQQDQPNEKIFTPISTIAEKPLVYLVLVDSGRADFGVIKDYSGCIPPSQSMKDGVIVGCWDTLDEGLIYIQLTSSIEARQDELIKHMEKIVEERHKKWAESGLPKLNSERRKLTAEERFNPNRGLDRDYDPQRAINNAVNSSHGKDGEPDTSSTSSEILTSLGSLRDKLRSLKGG